MIKEYYQKICKGEEVRENLIEIKKAIKDPAEKRILAYELGGDFGVLLKYLNHEEPKIRKNVALILGEMEWDELLEPLIQAYEKEEQLFVKSDYLKAIAHYPYKKHLDKLKKRLSEIEQSNPREGEIKHLQEESGLLRSMIFIHEKPKKHTFTGYSEEADVILMTNRCHREITAELTGCENIKMLAGGIRVHTKTVGDLLPIRTYSEMLFPIPGLPLLDGAAEEIGKKLALSSLASYIGQMHRAGGPFYFRVEIKGRMPLDKRGAFIRRLSGVIEAYTKKQMINSATDYEVEIRLVENKEGAFIPLLKLFTIEDERFAYRKEFLSFSILPVKAALMVELAKEYMTEGAQILDPFCGVGTMLIERMKCVKAGSVYGVDILEEAILKARENTEKAHLPAHYINRDILDFKHEYLFDEIISNLPGKSKTKGEKEVQKLYTDFLKKAEELLKDGGVLILYTRENAALKKAVQSNSLYKIEKEWMIQEKEDSYLLVLKKLEHIS